MEGELFQKVDHLAGQHQSNPTKETFLLIIAFVHSINLDSKSYTTADHLKWSSLNNISSASPDASIGWITPVTPSLLGNTVSSSSIEIELTSIFRDSPISKYRNMEPSGKDAHPSILIYVHLLNTPQSYPQPEIHTGFLRKSKSHCQHILPVAVCAGPVALMFAFLWWD